MVLRRAIILAAVVAGNVAAIWATPTPYVGFTVALTTWALTFVYANLTKPERD